MKNKQALSITFLGTGTSSGVPMIGCECEVCKSSDTKDKRLRTSVLIECEYTVFTIDIGPDFRQQMLREHVEKLDAAIITHAHKDHVGGIDEVRAFNFKSGSEFHVYADELATQSIKTQYDYIFKATDYPGIPKIKLHHIDENAFDLNGIEIMPIKLLHYKLPVLGFRIHDFTYITDANQISDAEFEKIKGTKVLVLNALRKEHHISHFTLDEAIALATKVNAEKTYFVHMSHQMGKHELVSKELPDNMFFAFDGLKITV